MKTDQILKSLLVDGVGALLAIYIITIATPVIFQNNELLGIFSLFATVLGSRVCMQKIYSSGEWFIKVSGKGNKSRS